MKKLLILIVAILFNAMSTSAQCVTPSLSSVSTGGAVCAGGVLNLDANGPANVSGYFWTGPNSFSSTLQNPSISSATTASGGTYSVVVVNGTGTCSATYTVAAIVNAPPASSYVISENPICIGNQVIISPSAAWCNPFALACNGVNSTASTAALVSTATDNLTVEAWVLWNGGSNQIILENGSAGSDGYALEIADGSGTLQITLGGVGYMTSSAQLAVGIRQYVTIVRNAGIWSIYVNGTPYSLTNSTLTPNIPSAGFIIGNTNSGSNPFGGYIGNVAFWTIARSATQIQADMNTCSQGPQTGLAAYWGLGDGSGTSVMDASGNGNILTLTHTTWHSTQVSGAYTWNFGDGTSGVTGSAPAHTYTASGTYTVSVTSSSCSGTATKIVTVSPMPSGGIISGTVFNCAGTTTILSDNSAGGVWSSTNTAVATVSTGGVVSGVAAGTAVISYTVSNVCGSAAATSAATINATPAIGMVMGASAVCSGSAINLTDAASGGVWSSSNSGVATIGTDGTLNGVAAGIATISYTMTTGVCTNSATTVVTVSTGAVAGSITGLPAFCVGTSSLFYDASPGGVWSSNNTPVANVDAVGNVSGVSGGTATISYSVTTCNTAIATKTVTVNALPVVTFTSAPTPPICTGTTVTYATQAGQYDYTWNVPGTAGTDYIITGGGDTASNNLTLQWLNPNNWTVSVNYNDMNGCNGGNSNNTTISSGPVNSYNVGPNPTCAGTPVSFITEGGAWCNSSTAYFDNYTSFADAPFIAVYDNLTIEAWVQLNSSFFNGVAGPFNNGECVFVNGANGPTFYGGYGLYINGERRLEIRIMNVVTMTSGASVPLDQKVHVAMVRNAGTWSVYLNGVQYGVSNATASPTTPCIGGGICQGNMWIGHSQNENDVFDGMIGNLTVWTVPRTTAQIQGDMNSCSLSPQSGLAAFWPLSTGGSDLSGNGNSFYYDNLALAATQAASEYLWDFGDGNIGAGASPWHAYDAAGVYTVNVTSALCPGTSSMTVSITDTLPNVGVIAGTTGVCEGLTVALSDVISSGMWSSSNTGVALINSTGVVTSIATGTSTISYSLSNLCGTAAATAVVSVNTAPTVTFTASPSTYTCLNTPVTYTTQPGQTSYAWVVPGTSGTDYVITAGGTGSTNNSVTLKWLSSGVKTVAVNYASGGCSGTNAATSNIVVDSLPSYTIAPNPVCFGSATTFTYYNACNQPLLNFNGGNSSASIGTPVSTATDNITIEGVVQWNGGPNQCIFLNGNGGNSGYGLHIFNASGQMQILMGGVVFATSSATLAPGIPQNVAIVRNAGVWAIYLNGVEYPISAPTATPATPGTGFFIGRVENGTNVFNGTISKVAFWNVARTVAQIGTDLTLCSLPAQSGLAGYWQLGEGSGTTAIDSSGYGHNLALSNITWTAATNDDTYAWSFGDGSTSTASSAVHTYTTAGTYTASFTVTGPSGCANTASKIVTVSAPTAGTITGPSSICMPGTAMLSSTVSGGVWTSTSPGVATIGSSNGVVTGVTTGATTISYTVYGACIATSTSTVSINATVPAFSSVPPSPVCANVPATYTVLSGQTTYTWTIPGIAGTDYNITSGGIGSSSNSVTLSWLTTGNKTVTINYTGTNGCSGASAASNTTSVDAAAAVSYVPSPNPVCLGSPVSFVSNGGCGLSVLNFNGSNSTVSYGSPISTAVDNITIEARVLWNGGANQMIFINGNPGNSGYGLFINNSSGQLELLMGDVVFATSSATLTAGVSSTVAIVRNSGTWSIYVNGVQYAISSPTATPNTPGTGFAVGSLAGGGNSFNGIISNVAFWTVARTGAQMAADMTSCSINPQTGLAGYWELTEGTGAIANDESGNGHNLSLSNTTWVATPSFYFSSASGSAYSSYAWSFGDGNTSTLSVPTNTYSASGTFTSSLTVTSASGCSGAASVVVTVNTAPTAGSITGTAVTCQGTSTLLSDVTPGGAWSSGNTSVATAGTNGGVTGIAAGTAIISYIVNNGCVAFATSTVTINATTPVFTAMPPASACVNTPLTYRVPGGQSNYVWTVAGTSGSDFTITAGGIGSSDTTVTISWLTSGNKSVTANYTSSTGCAGIIAATATTAISNTYPTAIYSISPTPGCTGTPITFTPSTAWCSTNVINMTNGYQYLESASNISNSSSFTFEAWLDWHGGDGVHTQGIFAMNPYGYFYGLSVNPGGQLQIESYNPSTGLTITASSATLTPGQRTFVAAHYQGSTWTIYINDVAYPSISSAVYITNSQIMIGYDNYSPYSFNGIMANVAYWRTARSSAQISVDMNGCTPAAGALSGYWPLNDGSGYSAQDLSSFNIPLSLNDVAMWYNINSTNNYAWSFGDGGAAPGSTVAHTYTVPGVYTTSVVVTNSVGCSASTTQALTINATPALASDSANLACAGGTLNLFANGPSNVTTYSWAGPNSFTSTAQNPFINSATNAASGTYTVTVYDGGTSCSAYYTTTATINVGPALTQAFAPSLACLGGTLTLAADTPSNITGYLWAGPNSFSATSANPSISGITTAASGVYSVTVNNGTGSGCSATYTTQPVQVITVPVIGVVTGINTTCAGGESVLSDTTVGGYWFSGNPTIAEVNEITGVVTGIASGVADIGYAADNMCGINIGFATFTVTSGPAAISGVNNICVGSSVGLSDATAGGTWSSGNTGIATVDGSSGNVTGVAAGTATITYVTGTCSATIQVTVNASGGAGSINGTAATCAGFVTSLTDATSGGVWSSANTGIAIVGSTGIVTGVVAGTTTISYTINNTCGSESTSVIVSVNASPNVGSITGMGIVCAGATITLSDVTGGGAWSSGNTSAATVGSSGLVTGVASGTSTISYTVAGSCGVAYAVATVTVNPSPDAGSIGGTTTVCMGSTINLTDGITGGGWSSNNTSVANVGITGIVNGVAAGTAAISYTVSGGCGSAFVTVVVTVNATYAGTITGPSNVTVGSNITLTDIISGGIWSASNTNASVSGGVVTGVAPGTVTISYAVAGVCGTSFATEVITVNSSSLTGINGNAVLCAGGTITLSDATTGGVWSMGSLVATVVGSTGVVTASNSYSGTATVTYTTGSGYATVVITVNPNPKLIQGATSECAGATITLTDATGGGVWSSTGDATVSGAGSSGTLVANGVGGTAAVTYTLPTGCMVSETNTIYANPLPIGGMFSVCIGGITTLTDASTGANWSSSNSAIAVASGPSITGESAGTAVITFASNTSGYCYTTQVVTVSPQPAAINGNTGAICPGATLSLTDGMGLWSSSNTAIATIGSTGLVTGLSGGTATITYLSSGASGCLAKTTVTVNTTAAITGSASVCPGGTTLLHNAISGGNWNSGETGIATISAGGIVTGSVAGTANITYTTTAGCTSTLIITVSGLSTAINGNLSLCQSASTTLSDATSGGTWSMGSSVATVVGSTGVVTASASLAGTGTISYTVGGCSVTGTMTVNGRPMPIQGATAECAGVTVALTDATTGGTWSGAGDVTVIGTSSTAILIAGAVGGTATVTYTIATGCNVTMTNTIYPKPQPIMGNFSMCVGLVTILSDASPVSSWSSSNTAIAIASGADISGESAGTATITFKTSATGNCTTTQVVTVSAMPVVTPINGPATISHAASPVSISDVTAGGVWTSSNTAVIALSGSTGSPIGATAVATTGSAVITYAVTISGCTTKVTRAFGAAASHSFGTVTINAGSTVNLADDIASGTWSSSDNGIAIVDGNGMVTGIMEGNVMISHETIGDDGVVSASLTNVTVTALPVLISVLPNPNKGTFTVKGSIESVRDEEVVLEVSDMLGQVIYRNKATAQGGRLNETITLSNMIANGMYILNVRSGLGNKTFHFVVEQ